jgi:hypothetical protein
MQAERKLAGLSGTPQAGPAACPGEGGGKKICWQGGHLSAPIKTRRGMGHSWPSDLKGIGRLLLVFLVLKHARRGNARREGWAAWEAHRRLGGGGGGPARVGGVAASWGRCRDASRSRSSSARCRPKRLFSGCIFSQVVLIAGSFSGSGHGKRLG